MPRPRREPPPGIPGATTSCVLLTVLTVMVAAFAGVREVDSYLRPLYFAVLFAYFHTIGRRQRRLLGLPLRLVQTGFLVLTLGFAAAAVLRRSADPTDPVVAHLLVATERGAVFLLGLSVISFGILLWIPELLQSQMVLRRGFAEARDRLRLSEQARQRLEQRFVDAARLQSLGELAAGVAHDLRNPLAIIKATADSMQRRPREGEDLARHTEVISRNIDKAERTISGLLDLGKPRAGELRGLCLAALVEEVLQLVALESRRHNVDVVKRLDRSVVVRGDRRLLVQALLNLVLNALQAGPGGGRIRIDVRALHIGAFACGAVSIADHGPGLAPEVRDKLFNPFFTTKEEGTGLGLLSTRRIADELGGRIDLFPRTGGGARALLILPLAAEGVTA